MPRLHGQKDRARNPKAEKPHSWDDLDQLGLARDHYYNLYLKNHTCGRCGSDHMDISWKYYGSRGWRFRCHDCGQYWHEPRCTPGMVWGMKKNLSD